MSRRPSRRGFTILELLLSVAIFAVLGVGVVFLMRQGLTVFAVGTSDSAQQDRADTVLPAIRRHLLALYAGDRFDPPPPPPDPADLLGSRKTIVPPPAVAVRLLSGFLTLDFAADDPRSGTPCPWFAFVVANAEEWRNPRLRRDAPPGTVAKDYTPAEVFGAKEGTLYRPAGGLMEVCYIALPTDRSAPGVLTLFHGFRAPIGGPDTLLDPKNFARLADIEKRCRPVEDGLLHLGVTWRNAFATSFETELAGGVGDGEPYAGPIWDSTRALDPKFRLHRSPESLGDPSDDRFPAAVRLEVTLAEPSVAGFRRGETQILESVDDSTHQLVLGTVEPLLALRGRLDASEGWIKVGTEWMRFLPSATNPDARRREVTVERGRRGTKAVAHAAGDMVYVGVPSRQDLRLRVSRDAYARRTGGRIGR